MTSLSKYLRLFRPSQWYKNLLIPAVGIFSINIFELKIYLYLFLGFLVACGISGVNYIINDIIDAESDKIHPEKKNRPIASGEISKRKGLTLGIITLGISLVTSFFISFIFGIVMISFFLIAQLYSFFLKKIAFVDIITISINFLVRGVGGLAIILNFSTIVLFPTMWSIWAVFIFALFLGLSKRKADFQKIEEGMEINHKKVYSRYQEQLLDHLVIMIATILLLGYYLYVIDTGNIYLLLTVPVATYLMFRYLYLLFAADKNMGAPEKAIKDTGIFLASILVLILFLVIRYLDLYFGIL